MNGHNEGDLSVLREVAAMKRLKHPNVVVLHEVINNPKGREFYLVQEYMSAGSVVPEEERVDPLSITLAKRYFRDMLCGLEYLHFQGVIHRDIKPGNILVSEEGRCKIADFGTAAITPQDDDTLSDVQGTPAYWPPELFDPELKSYHGKAVDIWALGATLYTIVVGRPPFLANNQMELAEEVKTKQPAFPSVVQADPYLRDVLERMIEKVRCTTRVAYSLCWFQFHWLLVCSLVFSVTAGSSQAHFSRRLDYACLGHGRRHRGAAKESLSLPQPVPESANRPCCIYQWLGPAGKTRAPSTSTNPLILAAFTEAQEEAPENFHFHCRE